MPVDNSQFCTWEDAVRWLTEQPNQQELIKACYYDQPLHAAAQRYWQSQEWQSIQTFLPSIPGIALDVGAGNGISSYALARDGWQVSALEPDPSDLVGVGAIQKLAQDHQLSITTTQEFGENLPFPDASFDLVFARQVLHHAQDLPQLCREIHRVLRPGGTFIAVRDHVISSRKDLPKFFEIHPLHKLYGGENAFLLDEYTSAIKAAGFRLNHVVSPLENAINYAPKTKSDLKAELNQKIAKFPLVDVLSNVLLAEPLFDVFLKLLSSIDNRPGRLYSFVAHKS